MPHIAEATVRVDCATRQGPIRRIWTSFGYDETNWTCTPAGKRALKVIGQFAEQPYYVRSHYIFTSGIGWSLPHWGAGNVYHEDAAGRPFYDFTIADQVYDAVVEAELRPLVELAFTPRALVPDDAAQRFRYEPSPTQWSPVRGRPLGVPAQGLREMGRAVRALVEHCVARRCCARYGRRSMRWRSISKFATCRASSTSATPRCRHTGRLDNANFAYRNTATSRSSMQAHEEAPGPERQEGAHPPGHHVELHFEGDRSSKARAASSPPTAWRSRC